MLITFHLTGVQTLPRSLQCLCWLTIANAHGKGLVGANFSVQLTCARNSQHLSPLSNITPVPVRKDTRIFFILHSRMDSLAGACQSSRLTFLLLALLESLARLSGNQNTLLWYIDMFSVRINLKIYSTVKRSCLYSRASPQYPLI